MAEYKIGQEVEVKTYRWSPLYENSGNDVRTTWRKGKIINLGPKGYRIQFLDGTRETIDPKSIQPITACAPPSKDAEK